MVPEQGESKKMRFIGRLLNGRPLGGCVGDARRNACVAVNLAAQPVTATSNRCRLRAGAPLLGSDVVQIDARPDLR